MRSPSELNNDLEYAPPAFTNDAGERIVFVDFTRAEYRLEFDVENQEAIANSTVWFRCDSAGHPALSLRQQVISASLDGETVEMRDETAPDGLARFKSLSKSVEPGTHELKIKNALTELGPRWREPVRWYSDPNCFHCIFDMSDLQRDGGYLEAYLPSNYEYDHFQMTFRIHILRSSVEHQVFSNGKIVDLGSGEWSIECPPYFATSSPWVNIGVKDEYASVASQFDSVDGRAIPVLIYTTKYLVGRGVDLSRFQTDTHRILDDLERDFGPFPHESVTVFATSMRHGGMEYAGATTTGLLSLRHELDHSYFARSITPANGDAGWIDEAIASWADAGYQREPSTPVGTTNMGKRSPYLRTTHTDAYTLGRDFLAHLDHVLRDHGGMKKMLARYAERKRFSSVNASEFQELVEEYFRLFPRFVVRCACVWKDVAREFGR